MCNATNAINGMQGTDSESVTDLVPFSMAQCSPEREKRPPCPVPAILPVFPYPGDILPSRTVDVYHILHVR